MLGRGDAGRDRLGGARGLLRELLDLPATTAKPLPISPARAASMVALSASRFVCSAIEVMSLTTSPISRLEADRRCRVWPAPSAALTAEAAVAEASAVEVAISPMAAVICSPAAATVPMFALISSAAAETTCVWAADSSAPAESWVATADSSSLEPASTSAVAEIWVIVVDSESIVWSRARASWPISSPAV